VNTTFNIAALIGERAKRLPEYAPEPVEEAAQRLGLPVGQLIKLDANENPYGPTKRALAALRGHKDYHRYPDALSRRLRRAIGAYLGVDPARVLVGNGSDEVIDLILRLFRPGPEGGGISQVINCPPTFGEYEFYALCNDQELVVIPRDKEFYVDVGAIEALCTADPRPRILFVTSPNNPDGQLLPEADLLRLLALPLIVVLDEAYVEFSVDGSHVALMAQHDNLIVLRTFSKWAGLAGLRVGYGIFPEALMGALYRLKSPYNVNCAAQAAALATLEEPAEARATIAKIVADRERLVEKLCEFAFLKVYAGQANFVLCRVQCNPAEASCPTMETIRKAMERRGIMLRYYYGDPSLENCLRISVGTAMQNESVLVTLRALERQGGNDGQ
jgi:histidinol-phosphate aminotransferase